MQTHETIASFRSVTRASNWKFGITFGVIFFAFAVWPMIHHGGRPNIWMMAVAVTILSVTWLKPGWLTPFNHAWFRLGLALSAVVSPIVMGAFFFGAVVPLGLWLRRNGKDFLELQLRPEAESYWVEREPAGPCPGTFNKQF